MKRLFLLIFISLLFTPTINTFANANNFYFSDSTFDYYLSKDETGASILDVKESLTAVFPETNQNHGIERCIPNTYRGVQSLDKSSFSVTRNGNPEQFTTYTQDSLTCFRIGNPNSYVHNSQTYALSYRMNNVILNPDNSENQEFYWDTNGTQWSQKFDSLTANIHLSNNIINSFTGEASCYVGAQGVGGSNSMSRCATSISDQNTLITFSAKNLAPGENLTFDLAFQPNSFLVKKPTPNYLLFVTFGAMLIVLFYSIYLWIKIEKTVSDKKKVAKDKACPVQYIPPKNLTVAESGTVYLKGVSSLQVASLMELAVKHDIELEKGEKKVFGGYRWKIHVKRTETIPTEQKIVLEILNNGKSISSGDIIEVKKQSYSYTLEKLGRSFDETIKSSLETKNLFTKKGDKSLKLGKAVIALILFIVLAFSIPFLTTQSYTDSTNSVLIILNASVYPLLAIYIITFAIIVADVMKYQKRTLEGIKTSKYLDGLKEYMKLAEKDRIKFLQGIDGVETSHQNIVRLYEKLLPYAVLFRLEESWLSEMNKYYQMDDVSNPNWMIGGMILSSRDFNSFSTYTRNTISSSIASSSSGSSGGGGGGFSGGGGGGGGGGGW